MKLIRSKSLAFLNNKGWVWKTTIAYNTAIKLAEHWYKTVLVDLDTQCNLSRLTMGPLFEETLFSSTQTIADILKWIIQWGWDINTSIKPLPIQENLSLIPWSLLLSEYENLLTTAYNQAASGTRLGYFQTSAIQRYIDYIGLHEEVDVFVIDCSPNLNLLNRVILLGSDFFITPLMPDAFSVQWIQNLWKTLTQRKDDWKVTAKVLARKTPAEQVLNGEWIFLWYIINSYNQYAKRPISAHRDRIAKIPSQIKEHISLKHCKNGLVETSRPTPLQLLKDYWQLSADSQIANKAIFNLVAWKVFTDVEGTAENKELADVQFDELAVRIEELLEVY
jgi:cellulose biosynthesis protein BcsQ